MKSAFVFFLFFCCLLAGRDAFSHLLLVRRVDPVFMLTCYCVFASLLAFAAKSYRTKSLEFLSLFRRLSAEERRRFLILGLATWGVYTVTIFGISRLGATLFNFIDYGAMPVFTFLAGVLWFNDNPTRSMYAGGLVALCGLLLFLFAPVEVATGTNWVFWVCFSMASPVLTALCSALQKKQIDNGLHPDIVLLFRFPIPAVIMLVWLLWSRPVMHVSDLPPLLLLSFLGVFLPLLLLCYGFGQREGALSRFSVYLFLIPVLTFALGPLLVRGEWAKLSQPTISLGIGLVLLGYFISEFPNIKKHFSRKEATEDSSQVS